MAVRDGRVVAAYVLIVLLGGANGVAVRFTIDELAPFWGATLRFVAAAILLVAVALLAGRPFPRGRALVGAVLYGALGFGGAYAFAYLAIRDLGAGFAQVVLGVVPLLTLFLAVAHGVERLRWQGVLGAVLAVAGVVLAASDRLGGAATAVSLLIVFASALCIAESSLVVKRFPRADPVAMNAVAMGVGGAMLLVLSLLAREPQPAPREPVTWAALAYLVVVGSGVVFILYLYVLARWRASTVAYQFVLFPFVTVALAALLQGEPVTPPFLLGAAVVLAGTYVGAFWKGGRQPEMGDRA